MKLSEIPTSLLFVRGIIAVFVVVYSVDIEHASGWDGKGKGKHGHRHKGHHHGGHNFFGISPNGISYGYHDQNFGIEIGPLFGGHSIGHRHGTGNVPPVHDYRASGYGRPVYDQPVQPPNHRRQPTIRQPDRIEVKASQPNTSFIPTNDRALLYQRDAERAFALHNYDEALRLTRHAAVEDSQNGFVFLFGSQAGFASGQYESAISALDTAITLLKEDEWGYVVKNFRRIYNNDDYVTQMDRLVEYTNQNPNVSYPRTLRGYHYAYLGHPEAAKKQLDKALEIDPQDRVAIRLLGTLAEELPAPAPTPEIDRQANDHSAQITGPKN